MFLAKTRRPKDYQAFTVSTCYFDFLSLRLCGNLFWSNYGVIYPLDLA